MKGFQLQIKRIWLKILSFYIETLSFCFFLILVWGLPSKPLLPATPPLPSHNYPSISIKSLFIFNWILFFFNWIPYVFLFKTFNFQLESFHFWFSQPHFKNKKKIQRGPLRFFVFFFWNIWLIIALNKLSESKLLKEIFTTIFYFSKIPRGYPLIFALEKNWFQNKEFR